MTIVRVKGSEWKLLREAAEQALANAYAPYSRYHVGAALLATDGRVFTGVNVENASYGLTLCAERSAVAAAVTNGARQFRALVISVRADEPATPCGACRQVLREFVPSFPVRCYGSSGRAVSTTVAALLPASFGPDNLVSSARAKRR